MQELPIGVQDFRLLRRDHLLYVDKTARLLELIQTGRRYFLSRPRRFGKSLTLSTLESMFSGEAELFNNLAAKQWVQEQQQDPYPVVKLDISSLDNPITATELNNALIEELDSIANAKNIKLRLSSSCGRTFKNLLSALNTEYGAVVVLIDEYDQPILDHINNVNKAEEMRLLLRSFYTVLKSCDQYLRFILITGISKFSKIGVFSAMNNLEDISMDQQYGDIVGYTQSEIETYFSARLDAVASQMKTDKKTLLKRLKNYYDGFCFDGKTKLYNPFSILQCLKKAEFSNYWYESGSPSFIVQWMQAHHIEEPEQYRHLQVKKNFTSSQEIEKADPASFLYQSGYLTIEKKEDQILTLDYPNREVLDSLSSIYLELIYKVKQFASLGTDIWRALKHADLAEIVKLYNIALAEIPYDDFSNRNEFWYRSLFLMLLRGSGIIVYAEVHTYKGRSDLVIQFEDRIIVLEFKFAEHSDEVEQKKLEGIRQIQERGYAQSYCAENRTVLSAVLVADDEKRQVLLF